ncbi:hypothetical protein BDQ12DRAFT_453660 [Crucibulum laeve]|uniref:Cupredoxin n=1 Tax=Crucibulum laeve TaxID=68775 RepID=A0A5C3M7R5_9AGAR|nr:hypothetical protein BDQ12DRAFT_453660 [Crucibulum laeve]
MHLLGLSTLLVLLVGAEAGRDILVVIGGNNSLTFDPDVTYGSPGDFLIFEFHSGNHSVTQSSFASPCLRQAIPETGVSSGFQVPEANSVDVPRWNYTIPRVNGPVWFFCSQTVPVNHCKQGMVFALNPAQDQTLDKFKAAAMGVQASTTTGSETSTASATSASSTSPQVSDNSNTAPSGMSAGTRNGIIGGVVGGVVGLLALLFLLWWWRRSRKQSDNEGKPTRNTPNTVSIEPFVIPNRPVLPDNESTPGSVLASTNPAPSSGDSKSEMIARELNSSGAVEDTSPEALLRRRQELQSLVTAIDRQIGQIGAGGITSPLSTADVSTYTGHSAGIDGGQPAPPAYEPARS